MFVIYHNDQAIAKTTISKAHAEALIEEHRVNHEALRRKLKAEFGDMVEDHDQHYEIVEC